MRASWIGAVLVLFLALVVSSRAVAQQDDPDLTARTHFAAGQYQQALDIYAQLYAKTLHPTYLRNIGRCYQNMGEPDKAISSFHEYLRKAENLDPKHRAQVEGFIREMEQLKRERAAATSASGAPGAATAVAAPPAASAPVTGAPAAPVSGAPAPATDHADDSTRVAASLQASPAPREDHEPSPFYTTWWFWTAVTAVAVGGVATAIVLSSGGGTPQAMTTFGTQHANPHN
jgi:tetratricopeptide (TPR) repeat protein